MTILDRISTLIEKNGWSNSQFAKRIGKNVSLPTDWKLGRSKSYMKMLPQIADVLGTTEDYLRGDTDDPSQNENSPTVLETAELLQQYFRDKMGRDPTHEEFLRIDHLLDTYIKGLDK